MIGPFVPIYEVMTGMHMYSSLFVAAAFVTGVVCGGALMILQRYAQKETLKARFEAELATMCQATDQWPELAPAAPPERVGPTQTDIEDGGREFPAPPEWEWISMARAGIPKEANHVRP